jgi:Tol biopolymer transport system component
MSIDPHPTAQLATYRELKPAERQAIQAHLAVCDECRAQFEAFHLQDVRLSALPARLPRKRLGLVPGRAARFWNGVIWLGNLMAVGGAATMAIALVILVHIVVTSSTAQTASAPPAPATPSVPFAIPSDLTARASPWVLAAPWIGGAVAAVGLLFALGKRSRVWPGVGIMLSATLVWSYVPPMTALPNPGGFIWRITGSYSYDPNLPFKNIFIVSGDPIAKLRPYMDHLIGQLGLDPLDPVQPLARYTFERVNILRDRRMALVTTRFVYADGSSRVYDVPLFDAVSELLDPMLGFYLSNWRNDGLSRLRTEHLALPGQPFATESSPIRLGDAVRIKLSPQADRLDAINPSHWAWLSNRLQRLIWSPQGDAFLMVVQRSDRSRQLWLVPLDGSTPQPVTHSGSVIEYGWSPDGVFIVYTAYGEMQATTRSEMVQLVVVRRTALQQPAARRALTDASPPSLTQHGVWYAQDGALWLMDWNTSESARVTDLPGLGRTTDTFPTFWPVAVSPDGARVAYACGTDLCLMDVEGSDRRDIGATGIRGIAWDRTGTQLAATSLDSNNLGPVRMLIASRDGAVQHKVEIAPRDATDPPQWTPDGKIVFVQTYPLGGRRILAVNADTSQVLDLSREHWDAYFALSPDGRSVLLNNGRGGFWLAPVIR